MKKQFIFAFAFILVFALGCKEAPKPVDFTADYSIVPIPTSLTEGKGYFEITAQTPIAFDAQIAEIEKVTTFLSAKFSTATGFKLSATALKEGVVNGIIIKKSDKVDLGKEGYTLDITTQAIVITANEAAGAFYAVQTLLQLLPAEIESLTVAKNVQWFAPVVSITDQPRFKWRGMMLDVSRHFFDKEFILKYIDNLAKHKINTFHWHLCDDQGWRIEIKKYPKLTEIGAWRVDRENQPWNSREPIKEGEKATYGGFYTQEEVKEIVKYAAERFITVVPEIEMPGHTSAALAAYPQFSCSGGPFSVLPGGYWPITDIYCAGNDSTFMFLEDVLSEVIALFPGEYVHVGGDEATKIGWKKCKKCQKRIKDEKLKDEHHLQSYFIQRMEKFINSKGKRLIGWDEILEGGLAANATVMSWRGMEGGIAAAQQNHDVVMSPTSYCYFDYYQGVAQYEPEAIGGYLPLQMVYEFEPVPTELTTEQAKFILGAQSNLWAEFIPNGKQAEYMTFPRLSALAEVNWSAKEARNWSSFQQRMVKQYKRYEIAGINYARSAFRVIIHPTVDSTKLGQLVVESLTLAKVDEIRYTLDGTEPTANSQLYSGAFPIDKTTQIKAVSFVAGKAMTESTEQLCTIHKATAKKISLSAKFAEKYNGGGTNGLLNGIRGTMNFGDGIWQGYNGTDLTVIIDFEQDTEISKIKTGCMSKESSWIFYPNKVEYFVSTDGIKYTKLGEALNKFPTVATEIEIQDYTLECEKTSIRFLKVVIDSMEKCPPRSRGAGENAWLFVDEIMVE